MQRLSYDMCSCHQCSLYILSSIVHTANIEIRQCVKVKNNRKSLTVSPKSGRGRIQEVPTLTGKNGVLDWRLFMGGGYL